ncbi:hypothetical protein LRS06_08710 [Hymenobacter sp. J193]|uniref:hypothetical protein n=1 Tax=Hymenobacter sp. J193 TaxID=2898429 RepID=UPI00215181AA|nr:hypothetical protein [Hymenobacter sp. J193]MCR5887857.1 hypothetical protein [Hymenobacter sp. J193]
MKMLLRTPLFAVLLTAGLFASCEKENEAEPAKTKTELLAEKNWKLTAETVTPAVRAEDGELITDVYAYLQECDRDDIMRFEKAGACVLQEGLTQCGEGPEQFAGTWSFEANETILKTNLQTLGSSSFNVLELSESAMKIKGIRTIEGVDHTYTYTYAKQ